MRSAAFFLLIVTLAVAVVADNPYRYADLHAERVQRFEELYSEREANILPRNQTEGVYGWAPGSPYISTPADQLNCGSCYAFAAMHTVTDLMATSTMTSPNDISVQFALACCPTHSSLGYCEGGDPSPTANFMLSFLRGKGYPTSDCNPYINYTLLDEPACTTACSNDPRASFFEISQPSLKVPVLRNRNIEEMVEALKSGPLLAAIQSNPDFQAWGLTPKAKTQAYSNQSIPCLAPNHAVEIIGYVNSTATPYWIVKNSWSTRWADQGVVYVAAGNNELCIESHIPLSDGTWYMAVKDFPDYLAPYVDVAVDDPYVLAAANFLVAEVNTSCQGRVVGATQQEVQGYNFRLQVTIRCPDQEDEEYLVAISWDLLTSTFTLVDHKVLQEVTPWLPDMEPTSTPSAASTLSSALFSLF